MQGNRYTEPQFCLLPAVSPVDAMDDVGGILFLYGHGLLEVCII